MLRIPNLCLIFYLGLVVVELLPFLCFFAYYKLQTISETHAATLWQKLAADLSQWNSASLCKTNTSLKWAALERSLEIFFHVKNNDNW
jgi:hypothetical protein